MEIDLRPHQTLIWDQLGYMRGLGLLTVRPPTPSTPAPRRIYEYDLIMKVNPWQAASFMHFCRGALENTRLVVWSPF
jgi:hypothetical protein